MSINSNRESGLLFGGEMDFQSPKDVKSETFDDVPLSSFIKQEPSSRSSKNGKLL